MDRAQPLVARGASRVILTHLRQKCRSEPTRRQRLCAVPRADQGDPGLSGGLRELNNAPVERRQVQRRACERGVNIRVKDDVDDASFTLCSHLRPRGEYYTAVDPTAANIVLRSESRQKADRESAILAENGPDRRASQTGPKCALDYWSENGPIQ